MARNRVRFEMTDGLDDWIDRLEGLEVGQLAVEEWNQATDRYFVATQRGVHILSGELISSGSSSVKRTRADEIIGEVRYDAPYAIYEFARGGNHHALRVGWRGMVPVFEEALMAGILREFER